MQLRVSELLNEISLKNEAVDNQVAQICERLDSVEKQVMNLPEKLALILKRELNKHQETQQDSNSSPLYQKESVEGTKSVEEDLDCSKTIFDEEDNETIDETKNLIEKRGPS